MNASPSLPLHQAAATHTDVEPPPPGERVVVTRVFNVLEAEALRGCLEAQGIPATLGDVQTIQTDTLLATAMGGIRVMVPEAFARDARMALAAHARGEFAIDELPADDDGAPESAPESQVGMPRLTTLVIALLLLLGLLVGLSPGRLIH